jgi:hypothetical protein
MIPSTFFFLFSELGVGMSLTLLFMSPRAVGGGFFRFAGMTAAILLGIALGFNVLYPARDSAGAVPVAALLAAAAVMVAYSYTVDSGRFRPAYALLVAANAAGLLSVGADAMMFVRLERLGGWERIVFAANHVSATALLGAAMLTMVFGHWYLVIPKLSIEPLRSLTRFLIAAIVLRIGAMALTFIAIETQLSGKLGPVLDRLAFSEGLFFWPRMLFGILIPVVLAGMIWSTVKLRHTQAATGLLYLAVVAVLFGEFFSKFLLYSVRLSL